MLQLNFNPFPIIKTERLVLRPLHISDDDKMFFLRTDDDVNKYISNPKPSSIDDVRDLIYRLMNGVKNNEWIFWVMALKHKPELIGTICFWNINKETATGEIGYTLLPDHWGKGYMHEIMHPTIEYGFNAMKLKTIEAFTHKDNKSSTKLLEKNNFILNPHKKAEENADMIVYERKIIPGNHK